MNEKIIIPDRRLGRMPRVSHPLALQFSRFAQPRRDLPASTDFWKRRTQFKPRSFGNREHGDCTIASQCVMQMRNERLEVNRTPLIADEEAVRVYYAMTFREYHVGDGTPNNPEGDVGAYETDALNNMRRADQTFKDTHGRPLTIDAYVRVNAGDIEEIKNALATSGEHGLKFCINLPLGFQTLDPPNDWAIPPGQPLTGDWEPGSWGGHSMYADDYDEIGMWTPGTWETPRQRITWPAVMAYVDEVHVVIDSLDVWRKKPGIDKLFDLPGLRAAVNKVSSVKIK